MLNEHVVSLELAKKLKEAGYPQESLFYWWDIKRDRLCSELPTGDYDKNNYISAPIASELLEELPRFIGDKEALLYLTKADDHYISGYMTKSSYLEIKKVGKTASESLGNLWLHLKQQGLLTKDQERPLTNPFKG